MDPDLNIVPFSDAPPGGSPQSVDVFVRETSYPGDLISVWVSERTSGNPVRKLSVGMYELDGEEIAQARTDRKGRARFAAPEVEFPTTFEIRLLSEEVSNFIPREELPEALVGFAKGYQPLIFTTVLLDGIAPIQASTTVDLPKPRFEIDQTFGLLTGYSFPELEQKIARRKGDYEMERNVDKDEILEHFGHKGPGDAYVFLGHGSVDANGNPNGIASGDDRLVRMKELCDAANGKMPGIVFLGGCETADLLDDLIKCCAKVACGFSGRVMAGRAARAIKVFFEALLDGKSLDQATGEAQGAEASFSLRKKSHVQGGWTYDEILAAPSQPTI